jgi:hypothetical protein
VIGEAYNIHGVPGRQLLTLQADPGSPSGRALALPGGKAAMTGPRHQP